VTPRLRKPDLPIVLSLAVFILGSAQGFMPAQEAGANELAAFLRETSGIKAGLCIHVGTEDGRLTAALGGAQNLVVEGLSADKKAVEKSRRFLGEQGIYGRVSVQPGSGKTLPYADSLVNVLIIDDLPRQISSGLTLKEIMRVVCPEGVALIGDRTGQMSADRLKEVLTASGIREPGIISRHGIWARIIKSRPSGTDEWTQWRHGADGNAVSQDSVDVPGGFRWISGPRSIGIRRDWLLALVGANGRVIYSQERTEADNPRQCFLTARDAYNGLLLWKKQFPFVPGPRGLMTVGGRIYTTISKDGPLVALNAATGNVVTTYDTDDSPDEMKYSNGYLILITGKEKSAKWRISVVKEETGKRLWTRLFPAARYPGFYTSRFNQYMVAGDGRLFYLEGAEQQSVVCADLATGQQKWRLAVTSWPVIDPKPRGRIPYLAISLYSEGMLFLTGNSIVHAVSVKDGKHVWSHEYKRVQRYGAHATAFFTGGLLWVHNRAGGSEWQGLDPMTGEVKKLIQPSPRPGRTRCSQYNATKRFLICGTMDFLDWRTGSVRNFMAARHPCSISVIPANGLMYTFPHRCTCYQMACGFFGLAPVSGAEHGRLPDSEKRQKTGSAYRAGLKEGSDGRGQWPCYRHDSRRSGATPMEVSPLIKPIWQAEVGDPLQSREVEEAIPELNRITSPVIAEGKVFVASSDTHLITAIDADTGNPCWNYRTGGRIDTPPSIFKGLCMLGCNDGWVYCLRASDGEVAWSFRAAPGEHRIPVFGQLESAWPVHGNVLVKNGLAYFAAGRHTKADGGVYVYAAEPESGKVIWEKRITVQCLLAHLLVSSRRSVYMHSLEFNPKTGANSLWDHRRDKSKKCLLGGKNTGFLAGGPRHKNGGAWSYGRVQGYHLVFNQNRTYVTGDRKLWRGREGFEGIQAFSNDRQEKEALWRIAVPVAGIRVMILAGNLLFVGGVGADNTHDKGKLQIFSAENGRKVHECELAAPPVFDGMAAAYMRLYISTEDGKVLCLSTSE